VARHRALDFALHPVKPNLNRTCVVSGLLRTARSSGLYQLLEQVTHGRLGDTGADVIHDTEQKDVRYGRGNPPSIELQRR